MLVEQFTESKFYYRIFNKIKRAKQKPTSVLPVLIALIRGTFCILYHRVFQKNVKIRFPFYVYQKVTIKGIGKVRIGRSCSVHPNDFHGLAVITCTPHAEVTIGSHGSIGGLTIICHDSVTIGERFMTAKSLVQDTLLHHSHEVKSKLKNKLWHQAAPVVIGDNVWLGAQSYVLKGSKIGMDSVLANGSVCFEKHVNNFQLCAGNPVKRTLSIEHLLRLRL